jgi:tRNA-splicing ligase RtcB
MSKNKLKDKDLREVGYQNGRLLGLAIQSAKAYFDDWEKEKKVEFLQKVWDSPADFLEDAYVSNLVKEIILFKNAEADKQKFAESITFSLREEAAPLTVFGQEQIEDEALKQIKTAALLPVAHAAALMPDAHTGYGLPIGGVLAAKNAVIPYGVGVDIGCRMCLSVFDILPEFDKKKTVRLEDLLLKNTRFGTGIAFEKPLDDAVFYKEEFSILKYAKSLKDLAYKQIGSSGGGNHFVEFGIVEFSEEQPDLKIPAGKYLALLSHSGSRGFGASVANHYTDLAKKHCKLPKEARNLAFFTLDSELGMEYWLSMTLAGDYASACHHHIHKRMSLSLGTEPLLMLENHHNFAWKEMLDGEEFIVHRKGATPAQEGVYGIIPGSMTAKGYIVRGKGNVSAVNSASHGAGRLMSRSKALQSLTPKQLRDVLDKNGVTLIGGGLDEAPQAYKDIEQVMKIQQNLVHVVGTFQPKIVRMSED